MPLVMLLLAAASLCVWTFRGALVSPASGEIEQKITIVIDPGHGGEDGGAASAEGVTEAGINLNISLRLRDLLRFAGRDPVMIRTEDIAVYTEGANIAQKKVSDLKNRTRLVNDTPNALLVSIHQNFFEQPKYDGAQVFYGKEEGSRTLAEQMQEVLRKTVDPSNRRQAKSIGSVYLMEHAACPAVLVECGFLSNPEEARSLQQPEYQQKLASAITSTLTFFILERENDHEVENCIYLQSVRKRNTPLAGTVSVLRGVEQYCRI